MQYELKTQIIETSRQTFDHLAKRFGDKPMTRYQEGTYNLQAEENFHYRPTWAPDKELYDPDFSQFKLADPYSFSDPRQYYYTPYVTARSSMHEAFGKTLDYVMDRNLMERTPQPWQDLIANVIMPLRHYEAAGQMVFSNACRFSYGATIAQCCSYEGFDRIGNAQLISRVGIALGGGTAAVLRGAKKVWMTDESTQPLRKFVEEILIEQDWAVGVIALDLTDRLIDTLVYRHLDEEAIIGGAGSYSLLAQHVGTWYADHRKWLDALYKAWVTDEDYGASNAEAFSAAVNTWLPQAAEAIKALAASADSFVDVNSVAAVEESVTATVAAYRGLGLDVKDV